MNRAGTHKPAGRNDRRTLRQQERNTTRPDCQRTRLIQCASVIARNSKRTGPLRRRTALTKRDCLSQIQIGDIQRDGDIKVVSKNRRIIHERNVDRSAVGIENKTREVGSRRCCHSVNGQRRCVRPETQAVRSRDVRKVGIVEIEITNRIAQGDGGTLRWCQINLTSTASQWAVQTHIRRIDGNAVV